jgi:HlyD family secretion protein
MNRRIITNVISLLPVILLFFIFLNCGNSDKDKKIEVSGTIETTDVTISSKVNGEIRKLFFDEGAYVKINDTLAEIDRINLQIQEKQAMAGVELADAQLQLLLNGSREEDIKQAVEGVKQAKTNLESAELDKNRIEELFKNKSVSQKQMDDIQTRYKVALAQFKSADEIYKKLKRGARIEDINAAKARKLQSESQLELIRKQINDSYILSPAEGVISHKVFEMGEPVLPGSSLFTISDLNKVYLMIYVNEENLGKVKYGQKAEIRIDSHPEKVFEGKVTYISSNAEFTPKNIQTKEDRTKLVFGVKVEINNPEKILKPGMPADAALIITN